MSNALRVWLLAAIVVAQPPVAARGSCPTQTAPAPAPDTTARAAAKRHVESIAKVAGAQFQAQELVGLSISLASGPTDLATLHFGFEDREAGRAADDATSYRWASISKPLTAVLALQLAREGKLDLDADVRELVPEFPAKPKPIAARQLLCHQGGIVHYTNGEVIARKPRSDVPHPYDDAVDALDTFADSPLIAEPGTRFAYTTHGYMLLGAVCQRAGGKPYAQLIDDRIARPLGMTSLVPDRAWVEIPRRASGYRRLPGSGIVRSVDADVSWKLAGGGFTSNVGDMARFGIALCDDRLLDAEWRARMAQEQRTMSGEATGYGLGLRVGRWQGKLLLTHGGAQEKTRTALWILPEVPLALAIMTNSEWAELDPLCRGILDEITKTP